MWFTRARKAAFRTEGGKRERLPGNSMKKKRETSSPSPAVPWRGVRDCAWRARG
jgi:hypothetical protein